MAQPVEVVMRFFQSLFGRNRQLPTFQVNVPVIVFIFNNYTNESTSTPCHAAIIPSLLGFVQILCNGGNIQAFPFKPHSIATTMTCVFSMVLYYLASRARNSWFPNYSSQLGIAMSVSASISVASLVSLVVPASWWPMRYIIYILLVVVELNQCLMRILFDKCFGRFFNQLQRPWRVVNEERLLPQTNMNAFVYGNPYQQAHCMIIAPVNQLANKAQVNIDVSNGGFYRA